MARRAVDCGVAGECRSFVGAGIVAVVAADVGDGVGAVAAGGIGQGLENAGLNFGYVEDRAAGDAELGDAAEQYRRTYQNRQAARSNKQPGDEFLSVRPVGACQLRCWCLVFTFGRGAWWAVWTL
jgi:hypothetical protein